MVMIKFYILSLVLLAVMHLLIQCFQSIPFLVSFVLPQQLSSSHFLLEMQGFHLAKATGLCVCYLNLTSRLVLKITVINCQPVVNAKGSVSLTTMTWQCCYCFYPNCYCFYPNLLLLLCWVDFVWTGSAGADSQLCRGRLCLSQLCWVRSDFVWTSSPGADSVWTRSAESDQTLSEPALLGPTLS